MIKVYIIHKKISYQSLLWLLFSYILSYAYYSNIISPLLLRTECIDSVMVIFCCELMFLLLFSESLSFLLPDDFKVTFYLIVIGLFISFNSKFFVDDYLIIFEEKRREFYDLLGTTLS